MTTPDIFRNVHKGIRFAMFRACSELGAAGSDPQRQSRARMLLQDTLHFLAHHGQNEDLLLLPLLQERLPRIAERMIDAHGIIEEELSRLKAGTHGDSIVELYDAASDFLALYLNHMREEEAVFDPLIREVLSTEELLAFARESVARTKPHDQEMMLGFMLASMSSEDSSAMLARLPSELAGRLSGSLTQL